MAENIEQPDRFRKVKELVQNIKTNETVKHIKLHLEANKATYIVGAIGVIAYASKSRPVKFVIKNNNDVRPIIAPVFNNTINNAGYLHKMPEDVISGQIWKKIGDLAYEISQDHGITYESARTYLSQHLNGHTDHVYGRVYKIAGIGATPAA